MTVGQKGYAIRKAYNVCDAWRDKYDYPNRFSAYYYEAMACVNEATVIGIRADLGLKIRYKDGHIVDDQKEDEKTIISSRDMHKIKCNYSECDWGQGLAGMGRCSGNGNPRDAQCPKFTTEAGDYNPEGGA